MLRIFNRIARRTERTNERTPKNETDLFGWNAFVNSVLRCVRLLRVQVNVYFVRCGRDSADMLKTTKYERQIKCTWNRLSIHLHSPSIWDALEFYGNSIKHTHTHTHEASKMDNDTITIINGTTVRFCSHEGGSLNIYRGHVLPDMFRTSHLSYHLNLRKWFETQRKRKGTERERVRKIASEMCKIGSNKTSKITHDQRKNYKWIWAVAIKM